MSGVNKVILIGNLGRDPETKVTPQGTTVAKFSIATSEKYKGRDGNYQENTEWHNIVAWSKLAEICGQYLKKGSSVFIEGKIQTRSWDDKDGNKRYATEIVAREMKMLGGRQQESVPVPSAPPPSAPPASPGPAAPQGTSQADLPF